MKRSLVRPKQVGDTLDVCGSSGDGQKVLLESLLVGAYSACITEGVLQTFNHLQERGPCTPSLWWCSAVEANA